MFIYIEMVRDVKEIYNNIISIRFIPIQNLIVFKRGENRLKPCSTVLSFSYYATYL